MTVRAMEERDEPAIAGMIAGMIGGPCVDEAAAAEVRKYRSHPDYEVWVADVDACLGGFGVVRNSPFEGADDVAELGLFQVAAPLRKRGIGADLLAAIEDVLRDRGVRKLYTTTNPRNIPAVRYWIGRGFQFESRLSRPGPGTDLYVLSKDLCDGTA